MNYEEFLNYVQEKVTKRMDSTVKVQIHKVIKNNDIELDGLSIMREGECMSPTIYLNDYYKSYYDGKDSEEVIDEILQLYHCHKDEISFDINAFQSYEQMKEKIAYKLINYETNTKLLEDIPHQRILDLAIVFYVVISIDSIGAATILIRHEHMDLWNITESQLYEEAKKNTPILFKEELQDIEAVIYEFFIHKDPCIPMRDPLLSNGSPQMYVLTNTDRINGAATMLYENLLATFADEIEKNLYILPSSIHEVILVPATSQINKEDLEEMVLEVNTNEVSEGERLSNHVYFFDRTEKVLCM